MSAMAEAGKETCVSFFRYIGTAEDIVLAIVGQPAKAKVVEKTVDGSGRQRRRSSVLESMAGIFRKTSTTETIQEPK